MLKQLALIACILVCGVDVNASPVSSDKDEYTLVIAQGEYRGNSMVSAPVTGLKNCLHEGKNAVKELNLEVSRYSRIKFYCVKK